MSVALRPCQSHGWWTRIAQMLPVAALSQAAASFLVGDWLPWRTYPTLALVCVAYACRSRLQMRHALVATLGWCGYLGGCVLQRPSDLDTIALLITVGLIAAVLILTFLLRSEPRVPNMLLLSLNGHDVPLLLVPSECGRSCDRPHWTAYSPGDKIRLPGLSLNIHMVGGSRRFTFRLKMAQDADGQWWCLPLAAPLGEHSG